MKPIVLISGKQGSGKSTLARNLYFQFKGDVEIIKFADPIYALHKVCLPMLKQWGIRPNDMQKDGELLQVLGTEYGRKCIKDSIWVDICRARVNKALKKGKIVVIDDARFENEAEAFRDAAQIRLRAGRHIRKSRCSYWRENEEHPSETGLDEWKHFNLILDTEILMQDQVLSLVMGAMRR